MDMDRFARIVYDRRNELGLTQEEVEDNGGPTDTTLGKIENAEWTPGNRKTTFRKLDIGLEWEPGSAKRTLDGGDPTPIPKAPEPLPPLSTVPPFRGTDSLRWRMTIEQKPESDRTDEERAWLAAARAEQHRLSELAARPDGDRESDYSKYDRLGRDDGKFDTMKHVVDHTWWPAELLTEELVALEDLPTRLLEAARTALGNLGIYLSNHLMNSELDTQSKDTLLAELYGRRADVQRQLALRVAAALDAEERGVELDNEHEAQQSELVDVAWPPARELVAAIDSYVRGLKRLDPAMYQDAIWHSTPELGSQSGVEGFLGSMVAVAGDAGGERELFEIMRNQAPRELQAVARQLATSFYSLGDDWVPEVDQPHDDEHGQAAGA